MKPAPLSSILSGGDRRSIGKANQVAARILLEPNDFSKLIECLWHDDPVVRLRAADTAEKVSVKSPGLLKPFKSELLGLADEVTQIELRWHLALMLPRLPLTRQEKVRVVATLRNYLSDRSSIVKTFALEGLSQLAKDDIDFRADTVALLEQSCRAGTPAMKARSRKLLKELQKP